MNQYRSVLEVLKLADEKSVMSAIEVCSTWSKAASSKELYREKCESEIFGPNSQVSFASSKAMFQSYLKTQTQIVHVTRNKVRFFSCKKQRWSKILDLEVPLRTDQEIAWTFLPDESVLSCGGTRQSLNQLLSEVYLLQGRGEVTELTPMNQPKKNHKCIFFLSAVYVFGGFGTNQKPGLNEKLEIATWPISKNAHWKLLPEMLFPSTTVTPCGYGKCIYLVTEDTVERFTCEYETYTHLAVSLPWESFAYGVFHEGEIIRLEKKGSMDYEGRSQLYVYEGRLQLYVYRIKKRNLKTNLTTSLNLDVKRGCSFELLRTTASKVVDNCLFLLDSLSRVQKIDLDTGVVTRIRNQLA